MILILSVSLVACSAKNPNLSNNGNANTPADSKYTKEFTYLPSYNGAQSTEFTPATTKEPLAKARYIIKNTTDVKAYEDYEDILKKEGWTITKEERVINFSVKKDTHTANISLQISGNDVILTVQSK